MGAIKKGQEHYWTGYGDVTKVASSMNENSEQREERGDDVRVMIDAGTARSDVGRTEGHSVGFDSLEIDRLKYYYMFVSSQRATRYTRLFSK